ncbi:MAG: ABC transporter permease [Calditrichaeota bacterium]|nr:ABC transporter permease [Calditrichota bacterium]
MIRFLWKGLIRDRSRSLFPILIVMAGSFLTVFLYCWIGGVQNDMIWSNAAFQTGHVKIMSRAYAKEADQLPNDLALMGVDRLMRALKKDYPEMIWLPRIRFGGLLDIPDENMETRSQAPVMGLGIRLLDQKSPEREILNLKSALVRGRLPEKAGEVLISDMLANQLKIDPGRQATLISSTMFGSMAMANFMIVGTVRFGVTAMDRGALVADIGDVQNALDMNDAAGEIVGFFTDHIYRDKIALQMERTFNAKFSKENDEFSPQMIPLSQQNGLGEMLAMTQKASTFMISIFVFVMSIVLWNTGLMSSIRRYGEIGVRLAMGEAKGHVYRSLIYESLIIGFVGAFAGSVLGLAVSFYLQIHGVNFGALMKNSTILISEIMRARVTPASYFIGFVPGLFAPLIGTSISGIGIYKRQTCQLFKELEV